MLVIGSLIIYSIYLSIKYFLYSAVLEAGDKMEGTLTLWIGRQGVQYKSVSVTFVNLTDRGHAISGKEWWESQSSTLVEITRSKRPFYSQGEWG